MSQEPEITSIGQVTEGLLSQSPEPERRESGDLGQFSLTTCLRWLRASEESWMVISHIDVRMECK